MGELYEMPVGWGMAPSPSDERAIPVNNYPASDPRMFRLAYDAKYEPLRQERIKQLVDLGVQKDVAALQATREFELDRPTISANFYREHFDPAYQGTEPVSPRTAYMKAYAEESLSRAMQGLPAPGWGDDNQADDAIRVLTGEAGRGQWVPEHITATGLAARERLLDILQMHAPQGEYSDKSGISEREFNSLQEKHGDHANFMYPDRLQGNFDALRQYELFSAGTDRHEPTQPAGIAFRAMGGVFRGLHKEGAADFSNAVDMALWPKDESTAREAMRWYESSRPDRDFDGYQSYRQPNNDAKFWTHSTTTPTGLIGAMGEDTSRRYGRWSAHTMPYTQDPSIPSDQKAFLGQVRADTNRPVSIVRDGLTSQDTQSFHEAAKRYGQKSDAYLGAQFAKTFGEYPTPFAEGGINLLRNSGDIGTLASVAAGGVGGAAGKRTLLSALKGAGGGLVRSAGEEVLEGPTTDMFALPALGYSAQEVFLNSPKENALAAQERNGEIEYLHPTHPKFNQTVDSNMRQAEEELGREAEQYNRRRRSPLSGLR